MATSPPPPPPPPHTPALTLHRHQPPYLISTSPALLSPAAINAAFALPALYWCKPLPPAALQTMLDNSLCLGVYIRNLSPTATSTPSAANASASTNTSLALSASAAATAPAPAEEHAQYVQIGLARLITDRATFAYLTDVYVLPPHQGRGLGAWLIGCVDEVLGQMEGTLRRAMLVTSRGARGEGFYGRALGMGAVGGGEGGEEEGEEGGDHGLVVMSRRGGGSCV